MDGLSWLFLTHDYNKQYFTKGWFSIMENVGLLPKEFQLEIDLTNIYKAYATGEHDDNTDLLHNIISLVEEDYQKCRDSNPYILNFSSNRLANAFLSKYKNVIENAEEIAYKINTQFGHINNLAKLICPYVLYLLNVPNESIKFYFSLVLTLSYIICDSLAKKKGEKDKEKEKRKRDEEIEKLRRELDEISEKVAELAGTVAYNKNESEKELEELIAYCKEIRVKIETIINHDSNFSKGT